MRRRTAQAGGAAIRGRGLDHRAGEARIDAGGVSGLAGEPAVRAGGADLRRRGPVRASGAPDQRGGKADIAGGEASVVIGKASVAVGNAVLAIGKASVLVGTVVLAIGEASVAVGNAVLVIGKASVLVGTAVLAIGEANLVGDTANIVGGNAVLVIGKASVAVGTAVLAIGEANLLGGEAGVVIGNTALVFGEASVSVGNASLGDRQGEPCHRQRERRDRPGDGVASPRTVTPGEIDRATCGFSGIRELRAHMAHPAAVALGRTVVCWLLLVVPVATAGAQNAADAGAPAVGTPRIGTAQVVSAPPSIDGRLNDAVWENAARFTGFVQRELHEGQPVTERTEVRVLTDGDALYVGAWLFDRDPGGIVPGEKIRDVTLSNSDYFGFILDTYLDRQNGFVFATTPTGVEYDGQVIKEGEGAGLNQPGQGRAQTGSMGGFNRNWDGSWTVSTSVDSAGWYAEFRIPFSTLRYGGGATQTWGLNLVRGIRRNNEEAFWSFIPRQFSLYRLSRAGTLEGIRVPVRRTATVTPYILGGMQRNYLVDAEAREVSEVGADLKYGVTPSLTLDFTYNTDFAQAEVDEQRTNLTRFPLFFPEKRQFFLENAGVFSAGTPQAVELFFSRRIGIDTVGNPVPVRGGGRVSGRVGALTVGALQIFTGGALGVQPANSYSVGRVTRELSARSRVGLLAVHRMATHDGGDRNSTYGIDGRLGVGDAWTVDWWGAKTETPGRAGDDLGFSARAAYETGAWENSLRYIQVGEDFDPQVGFLNRFGGYRLYDIMVMRKLRKPEWAWLKEWNPHVSYRAHVGLDGYYQTGRIHIDMTEVELADGARFGPDVNIEHEGLREPFQIARGVIIPPGSYDYPIYGLDLITNPSAPLSLSLRAEYGGLYDGTRTGGNATVTMRRGASLTSSVLLDYHDVRLDEGDFVRYLVGTRFGYYFTPRLFLLSLVQYSNQARVWTANARFGWLNTAGTGLFVVFNDGREADGFFDWTRAQARSVVVKYTRQFGR